LQHLEHRYRLNQSTRLQFQAAIPEARR